MRIKLSMVSLGLIALCGAASAQEANPVFSYSGFGTIGYAISDSDSRAYNTGSQLNSATTHGSFEPDTNLGFQVNAKFNDTFSGTVQLFAKQDVVGQYGPSLEWAFLKAKLGSNFSVRVGRMGGPFFMTSDFRNVGYTNVSMRTPIDVYAAVPVRSFDGADVLYQGSIGDVTINGQLWGGKSSVLAAATAKLYLNDVLGFAASAEIGPLTLRAGHVDTTFDSEGAGAAGIIGLSGQLKGFGAAYGFPTLVQVGDDILINGKKASFSGVGAVLDLGDWLVNAEYTKRKSGSLYVSDLSSWYTTVGYRVKSFTPYVTVSARQVDSITTFTAPSAPAPLAPTVAALVGGVNANVLGNAAQNTLAFGTRWDAGKSYAVKAEWAAVSVPAGSSGLFRGNVSAQDTTINVFSAGIDFVF
jgi:hypothetical protein